MNVNRLDGIRADAERQVSTMSWDQITQLAEIGMALGEIRRLTMNNAYYREALRLLHDLAPSLAIELVRLVDTTDTLYERNPTR